MLAQFDKLIAMAMIVPRSMIFEKMLDCTVLGFVNVDVIGVLILITLFGIWKLDFIATLLNMKSFAEKMPDSLKDMWKEEEYEKAREYNIASAKFSVWESIFSLTLLLSFWFLGGFPWLDQLCRGWFPDSAIQQGLCFLGLFFAGQHVLALPFSIYDTFVIEEKFGFNKTTVKTFIVDQLKGVLLSVILGLPIAALVLWIFAKVPHAWLWAWIAFSAIQLLLMWLAPAVIMPLFNKFQPMPDGELKSAIEAMAKKCNFPNAGLFIMDGSKRSTKANAFFTGIGKTKKIALFDTLIERHSVPELVAILAHEIGHFQCKHIPQRLIAGILQSGVMFFLIGILTNPDGVAAHKIFSAFGVEHISPHVGLVLFSIIFSPISRLTGIIFNAWSRKHEFEADAYAATHTGSSATLISALKKLSTDNLSHPTPHGLRVLLDYSHPPMTERLAALEKIH